MHIEIKHLPKLQAGDGDRRKRFLYAAIDRCSRAVHVAVKNDETEEHAVASLPKPAGAFPFQLTPVLTDNGSVTQGSLPRNRHRPRRVLPYTRPRTPQTNGVVERFNGRISSEALGINITSYCALEQLLRGFNTVYNAGCQRVLDGITPNQLAGSASCSRVALCDTAKAVLGADAATDVSPMYSSSSTLDFSGNQLL